MTCASGDNGIMLRGHPCPGPFGEAVLFGFDRHAFPFQQHVQTHLIPGRDARVVLPHGPPDAHDAVIRFYGTVLRIDGRFHMWYFGSHGERVVSYGYGQGGHTQKVLCYAVSDDGIHWEKPSLGLVEFNGSKNNNIVEIDDEWRQIAASVIHEPDEPDPGRRFKMAYESNVDGQVCFCVAFSPDGLRWRRFAGNPVGPFLEMVGLTRFNGFYYLNGQDTVRAHTPYMTRKLATFVSGDFERWSPCAAVGLDRSPTHSVGPLGEHEWNNHEEVHLGAGLWNRGNVLVGIYGQWHGTSSGDRRGVGIDLGLSLSHDGLFHHEPIPGFRIVPAREQPEAPIDTPALMQGQGMENVGEKTYHWYSLWRGNEGTGVRMVQWERDRLGMLKPYCATGARTVSCVFAGAGDAPKRAFINVSGLGAHAMVRVNLLEGDFRPVDGYSGSGAAVVDKDHLRAPLRWGRGDVLPATGNGLRLEVVFDGVRPEDAHLHAVYLTGE